MARKKMHKSLIKSFSDKNIKDYKGQDGMAKNIALGATGLAITAGVVAVGAAMVNKNMRNKMSKAVEGGVKMMRESAAKAPEQARQYMATAHQIAGRASSKRTKSRRGRRGSQQKPVEL